MLLANQKHNKMNSPLFSSLRFEKDLRSIQTLPKNSEKRMRALARFLAHLECRLQKDSPSHVQKFLSERYTCPIHRERRYAEPTVKQVASTVASAFSEPGVLKSLRFALDVSETTRPLVTGLSDVCIQLLSPRVKTTVREISGQYSVDFQAA